MEHWPGDERQNRTQDPDQSQTKGKKKPHAQDTSFWHWPHLEYGSIGRATLVPKDGRVQWSTAVDTSRRRTLVPLGKPTRIFPATRPPQLNVREHSARKRTEQGLQYLRTHFPDADFPAQLVGGELDVEAKEARDLEALDPFLGNLLEILPSHRNQDGYTAAYPMGELNRELNISQFCPDASRNMLFKPSGASSFTFETPILQISSGFASSPWVATPSSTLVVRTYTSASLLRVVTRQEGLRSKVTRELDITRSDIGNAPIMDSRILAAGPDMVVVDRNGTVYKCNAYRGGKAMQLIGCHTPASDDNFWQLGTTHRNDECFLTSCKAVKHLDFRSAGTIANVFSLNHTDVMVTSFECPTHDYLSRVTTTSEVIWLDDRFRRRPLMSFKHQRSYDRTLRVLTADLSSGPLSLLMSRRNDLVTVYDVNRATDGLTHCNSTPACFPRDGPTLTSYNGHTLIVSPSRTEFMLLRLRQQGSIHRQDIRVVGPDEDELQDVQEDRATHHWNGDVQRLDKLATELQPDFGPVAMRHYTEVDFRGAYQKIFVMPDDSREDAGGETFGSMMDRLPNFWSDADATIENMLTMSDVAFRAEEDPKLPSRADFFTGGSINSKRGFHSLIRDRLPFQNLASAASWHYNIRDTLTGPFYDHSGNWPALHESLKELDLVSDTERPSPSLRREAEAREQLVLDLALSSNVYSAHPFGRLSASTASAAALDTIPKPASEMSFGDEPPEVEFGYLRPVLKVGADHYANRETELDQDTAVSSPVGVRLLLAEWKVGTDPADYRYRDPYGVTEDTIPHKGHALPTQAPATQRKQLQSQRPPPIQPMQWPPSAARTHTVQQTHSQTLIDATSEVFSQELAISTQVLPGPFGGRPVAGAKKPVRKRLGGF
ncbi:hypothetical protein PAXRUDRAFT_823553 [Paxillus rubicundulus Ve08.2h10]|uniref:Uncharacterized protein n=1 Tax=Paxillus rubicundulus Ve08.2h10 TaxID=930991 RepID=A0A0D0DVD1_9AGAM|nr:hypothetical protein PAXRUDRAFT_823553 [Paxillus rubicundulus Ve08.2h10]